MLCDGVQAHLRHGPGRGRRGRRGEHEPRDAPQRRLADARERRLLVALAAQLDGLQRADVARDEGEDGHADAALDEDPEVGQLEEPRGRIFAARGAEELAVPGSGEVGEDDERGSDAAETLEERGGALAAGGGV